MIELIDVTKVYPDGTEAVRSVSLSISKGETMVLIGPSGCGKTTLLKTINRLIPCTSGSIVINGQDVAALDTITLRRRIGYVIQQIGLFPHLSILENTTFVLKLAGVPLRQRRERAVQLLEMVGLPPQEYLYRFPNQLSGGQQQRIGVARALAADPDIILMDEPFGALDPITREQVQDEFIRLQAKVHKTIVFVTHSMQEARKMGDRIAIMQNGNLVQAGSSYELYKNPANAFVRDFIGAGKIVQLLEVIQVEKALDSRVPTCRVGEGLDTVKKKMQDSGWNSCFVLAESGLFMGAVSLDALAGGKQARVGEESITLAKATVTTGDSLRLAVETMLINKCGYLPVTDKNGIFKGMISYDRISEAIA